MDAFEQLMASLLNHKGFWVKQSYKVVLTKDEKKKIGRPSAPRWELDLIAYQPRTNELWVVECKSFLDSYGVWIDNFKNPADQDQYKLFNEEILRDTVFSRMVIQLAEQQLVRPNPRIKLCLAAGHVRENKNRGELKEYFADKGWKLLDEKWILESLATASETSYENDVAFVVAKILERNRNTQKKNKSS